MSDTATTTTTGEQSEKWTDELPITSRAATNIAKEYDSAEDLIEAYREAEDITEISFVGSATMDDLREFIHERDPEAEQVRKKNDESICTEFTTDHGLDEDLVESGEHYFAFICPRCGEKNPLHGTPDGFGDRPYACVSCQWVSLLDGDAMDDWMEDVDLEEVA